MANGIDIYGNYILPAATGVKNAAVSLFKSDDAPGDYSSRKASLARQQKLADALAQMGAQEQTVYSAGGITAPVSPMGALARGLTSFGGSYLSGKAAADEAALKKAGNEELAKAVAQFGKPSKVVDKAAPDVVEPGGEPVQQYTMRTPDSGEMLGEAARVMGLGVPGSEAIGANLFSSVAKRQETEAERERVSAQEAAIPKPAGVSDAAWNAAGGIPGSRTEIFNKSLETAITPEKRSAEYTRLVDAGYTPGTPAFNQQMQKFIRKDTYIAPVTGPSPGAPQSYIIDGKQVFTTPQDALSRAQSGSTVTAAPAASGAQASEGERKAATLLGRLRFSQDQLKAATTESPDAASPPAMGSFAGSINPILGNLATPEARQRVEAAQLDILDAALTLGTGAAYTKEQLEGYRKSYFPQYGDKQKTKEDKKARLDNVIKQAEIAAGRAAGPAVDPDRAELERRRAAKAGQGAQKPGAN